MQEHNKKATSKRKGTTEYLIREPNKISSNGESSNTNIICKMRCRLPQRNQLSQSVRSINIAKFHYLIKHSERKTPSISTSS